MQQPTVLKFDIEKLMRLNIIWTIILVIAVVIINLMFQKPSFDWSFGLALKGLFIFLIYYLFFIVLHELCHLLGFILVGRAPVSSISYGIKPKEGVAYATTTAKLTNYAMKISLLLPFWLTGVLPTLLGFYLNNYPLLIAGAFLMAGAVGDFVMYSALRKFPNDCLVADDPEKPKLYVYTNI